MTTSILGSLSPGEPVVVLLSGGVDSTTVLAGLTKAGAMVTTITFDYGQTLARELIVAHRNAAMYGVARHVEVRLNLDNVSDGCSLLRGAPIAMDRSDMEINDGPPTSYVPFRNGIFLAYCIAYAEGHGATKVFSGCNGWNSGNYPDDTEQFIEGMNAAAAWGTMDGQIGIRAPFADVEKAEIVRLGLCWGLDYTTTYSCYVGGDQHCGRCDSCFQRRRAMSANGLGLEGRRVR